MPSKENFDDYLSFDEQSIFLSVDTMDTPQLYYRESSASPKRLASRDDVLKPTHEGFTLIHKALERGKSAALIKAILDLCTENILLKSNNAGETILHFAVRLQRDDVVAVLLSSPLTTAKVFFKSNFLTDQSVLQLAKDKKTSVLHLNSSIENSRYLALSESATKILHALFEKERELEKDNSPPPSAPIQTLREALDTLEKKLLQLREHEHFNAEIALKRFIATVRELDYDSDGKESPEFKQGYRQALEQLYQNTTAIDEINEQRGGKATLTWLVGIFYDVASPQNRDRFFTPHTHTSRVLETITNIFSDSHETIPSL